MQVMGSVFRDQLVKVESSIKRCRDTAKPPIQAWIPWAGRSVAGVVGDDKHSTIEKLDPQHQGKCGWRVRQNPRLELKKSVKNTSCPQTDDSNRQKGGKQIAFIRQKNAGISLFRADQVLSFLD
ncbi:MAG: hypothetical protein RIQ81_1517 [Pseudomonadota bacterium]